MRVAIIQEGKIINIVEAVGLADAQQSYPDCQVRIALDSEKALEPIAAPEARFMTVQELRSRFTDAELASVVVSNDVAVKLMLLKLQTCYRLELDDPQISEGLDVLVSKGLLTAARRADIWA